jgi:hypothetical protein
VLNEMQIKETCLHGKKFLGCREYRITVKIDVVLHLIDEKCLKQNQYVTRSKEIKKKVKLSRYTPWRHIGGEEV